MWGLFKRKMAPEGPVEFTLSIDVEAPPEEIYPLLDWADPRHAKRGEGHQVLRGSSPGRWHLVMTGLEHLNFAFSVTEEEAPLRYAYGCATTPITGRLASSHEAYRLERLESGATRVHLTVTAEFVPGMTEKQFARETATMSLACHNSLARLKIHAEYGGEAARDAQMMPVERVRVEV